jgi:hypothetical protein
MTGHSSCQRWHRPDPALIEDADSENFLGQVDADGSNLIHDFPSRFGLMMTNLNRGASMPCDFYVASG